MALLIDCRFDTRLRPNMDQIMIEIIRPEYNEAVEASRSNFWLILVILAAPFLIFTPVLRRWHWVLIVGVVLFAAFVTWVSVFFYSETIWETMEAHAKTAAEIEDVASDTGRVLGPFLLGIPLAVFYSVVWCAIAFVLRVIVSSILRSRSSSPPPLPKLRWASGD